MWKIADLNVLPHKVEILGIGIAKDKTNKTGETEWTGITPNARADRDPVGGLADLTLLMRLPSTTLHSSI